MSIEIIVAAIPLILFFTLITFAKRNLLTSILTSLFVLIVLGYTFWQINILRIFASTIKGVAISLEIILIVFGALLILEILKKRDMMTFLKNLFEDISRDDRVHVMLVGWGLIYFLEGVSGFGTPAMVAVPIFIALGFNPFLAVVISLIGDSVPVIFGAVGLPVTYGIITSLSGIGINPLIFNHLPAFIAGLNIIGSILIPILILFSFIRLSKRPLSHFIEFIPFAAFSGVITGIFAFIAVLVGGAELASIIGGLVAMLTIGVLAKYKILIPRTEETEQLPVVKHLPNKYVNTLKASTPYLILVSLLIVTRSPFLPIKEIVINLSRLQVTKLFGYTIDYSFSPFYSAGIIMLFSAIFSIFLFKLGNKVLLEVTHEAFKKTIRPFLALTAVLIFVQILIYSGENDAGYLSMLIILANEISSLFGPVWPVLAPFVGAIGSFTSGSATVSNLIFSAFQYQTAIASGFSPVLVLSLQGIGAAAGNMIAIHNIIAAVTVAGLVGKESDVIRKNLPILIFYLLFMGMIGYFISLI